MNPQVRQLYKQLLYMAKDYPAESGGYQKLVAQCKLQFRKTPIETTVQLEQALAKGDYIIKGMLELYQFF